VVPECLLFSVFMSKYSAYRPIPVEVIKTDTNWMVKTRPEREFVEVSQ
jgi:hypothetical protein